MSLSPIYIKLLYVCTHSLFLQVRALCSLYILSATSQKCLAMNHLHAGVPHCYVCLFFPDSNLLLAAAASLLFFVVNFFIFQDLLQNHWANINQT